MTLEEIRSRYPNPVSATSPEAKTDACAYCVGGAFMMTYGYARMNSANFPPSEDLADALMAANPCLIVVNPETDVPLAFEYAQALIEANDEGQVHIAWSVLELALSYRATLGEEKIR